jgi:hypothetical protein
MRDILLAHNYHWQGSAFERGIKRSLLDKIMKALEAPHIIAITGARRSGKSYIFRQLIGHLLDAKVPAGNIIQANFEDPFFISQRDNHSLLDQLFSEYLNLKNPAGMVYLFFDEIQNVPNWQFWIRTAYDSNKNIKLFITGSNSELLSTDLASHLTGRVIAFENFPLSFTEYFNGLDAAGLPEIKESDNPELLFEQLYPYKEKLLHYIELSFEKGLFPEVTYLADRELVREILSQYFQNVVFRDIIPRFAIRNTKVIEQLAYYLSTNFTSMYSYRRLADAVGTNENTAKEYVSYFEKAYLFFSIDYYEYSLRRQFKRNRKIYALDCGLRHATASSFSPDRGKNAENTVFQMLRRTTAKIYYWYAEGGREVDFVIKSQNQPVAINVSYGEEIPERELESFEAFLKVATPQRSILVTRNKFEKKTISQNTVELIPLWVFVFLKLPQ